jgi:hypothetical protein
VSFDGSIVKKIANEAFEDCPLQKIHALGPTGRLTSVALHHPTTTDPWAAYVAYAKRMRAPLTIKYASPHPRDSKLSARKLTHLQSLLAELSIPLAAVWANLVVEIKTGADFLPRLREFPTHVPELPLRFGHLPT